MRACEFLWLTRRCVSVWRALLPFVAWAQEYFHRLHTEHVHMPEISYARAVSLLEGLVRIPSLSTQEQEASAWLVEQMCALGYSRAFVDEAGNAVGELGRPDAKRVYLLLGHIDTVAGVVPVRIEAGAEGDLLFGRGSVDAKGPLATFVAAAAQAGEAWAIENDVRVVVVGAVEEEYATSKGARHIAARFDGISEPVPDVCIIGEPSGWSRVTLGYKGRLLLELDASQPMAHTAGPDSGIATLAVSLWNHVAQLAGEFNAGREKVFDQLQPSLRQVHTSVDAALHDHVTAQVGIRLPVAYPAGELVASVLQWAARETDSTMPTPPVLAQGDEYTVALRGARGVEIRLHVRGYEPAWREARGSTLARAFLGAIRHHDGTVRPSLLVKTGTSDMNVVAPIWGCPIVAYGPGDSALDHTPNEHLSLTEYWSSIQILTKCIRDLNGFLS